MNSHNALIPGGYVIIARKLLASGIMEKPPLFLKLWIWMLMKASHKKHGSLKRGQFRTSIDEMREAMAHKVGYRIVKPSRKEIWGIYDFLTKVTMIVTTKVIHGLVITILNYDYYQNPENYEGNDEKDTWGIIKTRRDTRREKNKIADSRISPLISFFSEECFSLRGWKPQIDGADGKAIKRALKGMTEDEVKGAITFYLKSPKAKDCGVTLKAALSTHSLNLYKAQKEKMNWQIAQ